MNNSASAECFFTPCCQSPFFTPTPEFSYSIGAYVIVMTVLDTLGLQQQTPEYEQTLNLYDIFLWAPQMPRAIKAPNDRDTTDVSEEGFSPWVSVADQQSALGTQLCVTVYQVYCTSNVTALLSDSEKLLNNKKH